jgi:DNA-binding GntR family transcriptional regulator
MSMSLTDRVYELLKADIITCSLEPGQQVAQSQLAEKYQSGLTPVREAAQRLVQEGFMTTVPRLGYVVSPVTVSDIHEIYELRPVAECAAARMAAIRASSAAVEEICRNADFTYVHRDRWSYSEFLTFNAGFHVLIASATGNQRLVSLVSRTLDELNRVFHLGLDVRDSAEEMRAEHLALATAVRDHNAGAAEETMRSQIERSQARVLDALLRRPTGRRPFAGEGELQGVVIAG